MKDAITFDPTTRLVTVTKPNGNTFTIATYDNAHQSHKRGAFVLGDLPRFRLAKDTTAKVLKFFYPEDSLTYLRKYGYIAS